MNAKSRVIGTSKVAKFNKITVVKVVAEILGVSEGDTIVFYKEGERIVIRKS